ncbi:MAG: GAF domain-containing protein [Bacteriovoracaceae bacterium]|jgi:GAF domain-containing protein/multidrug resistance efflux pump|nr:GAF domain-containing protein [Bacteriovoracaceae bacterium]
MALKKRFQKKEVDLKSVEEKEVPKEFVSKKAHLKLLSSHGGRGLEEELKATGDSSNIQKSLNFYHRINDLFQDESLGLSQIIEGMLCMVVDTLSAEGGSLWIMEENQKELICKFATGPGKKDILKSSVPTGKGIIGWVGENGRSSLILDATSDDRINLHYDKVEQLGAKSFISSALIYRGEIIGVLQVVNKKGDKEFNQSEKYLLEDICTQAAMHIKSSRLEKIEVELHNRIKTIIGIHEDFSSTMDLDTLLGMILAKATSLLKAEVGSVWLNEDSGDGIECYVAEGPTKDKVIGIKIKSGVGIVGWVVENKEPIIVEDCSKDSRFSKALDNKIGFVTESMITVPLSVKGQSIGAVQIINKEAKGTLFNQDDLELMQLFAASSAMYVRNAKLFESEKKAKELSALIEISKEITSTLDLDSVLMSVVNLSSHIIPYELAAISVEKRGREGVFELKSVSGIEVIDKTLEENKKLEALHNFISSQQGEVYIPDFEAYKSSEVAQSELVTYLEEKELKSFWAVALKDDQGDLGIISMESVNKDMINENKAELLSILIGQSTVALRNASLYNTIPATNVMAHMKDKFYYGIMNISEVPKTKLLAYITGTIAFVCAMVFLKVPHNVSANVEILPVAKTYYSGSAGKITEMFVKEGQHVKKGQVLAQLDIQDLILEKSKKVAQRQKVISEIFKQRSEGNIADYKIKEFEKNSIDLELELINKKIGRSKILSETAGVVISSELDNLIGMPVNFGQELIKVASSEKVYVQIEVPESDVTYVKSGQDVKFKVFSYPNTSFDDIKLAIVAGEGRPLLEGEKDKYFMARATLSNSEHGTGEVLRAGMTGRGKIKAEWRPLGFVLLKKVFNFLSLEVFF